MSELPRSESRSHLRIQHLHMLLHLLETGTVRGAADALSLSQSAVTKSLKDFEAVVGAPLFDRSAGGVRPTRYCAPFERFARDTLAGLDEALRDVNKQLRGELGTVCIGVDNALAQSIASEVLLELHGAHRNVRLNVRIACTEDIYRLLDEGELDFAFAAAMFSRNRRRLCFLSIARESLLTVARASHPLTYEPMVSTAQLLAATWVLPARRDPIRALVGEALLSEGTAEPAEYLEVSAAGLSLPLVQAKDLVTAVGHHDAMALITSGQLVPLVTSFSYRPLHIGLLRIRQKSLRPETSAVLADVLRFVRSRRRGRHWQPPGFGELTPA